MKRLVKMVGGLLAVLVVLAISGIAYLQIALPDVGDAPALDISVQPAMLDRGKYLAENVANCIFCHSDHDFSYYAGPVVPGTEGKGGFELPAPAAGLFYASNITPAAIGSWSDGEVFRAIAMGVRNDGEPLFPIMPYPEFNEMAESDLHAIIAYLRTLAPIENEVPKSQINFPLNLIMRTIPKSYTPRELPAESDTIAYGKYLAKIAACHVCHTPIDNRGQPLPGMDFAGGFEFIMPSGQIVRSANITQHYHTGIGAWDQAYFLSRFKEYADPTKNRIAVAEGGENTMMPWLQFAGMTQDDLTAIYRYLQTVAPVENAVEKYPK
ncbi:cytochrome C [bacterium]|nr:cytochrome C [bacterium]